MKAQVTKSQQNSLNNTKGIEYFTLFLLSMFIVGAPLFRGLFFQKEILISHVVSFGIFTLYLAHKIRSRESISLFNSSYDIVGLSFVLVYLLPIATGQWVNLRDAIGMLIRYANYFIIYLMVKDMIKNESYKKILLNSLAVSSLIVALIGVLGATGYVNLADVILGNRISSTFQYPNTLAALMMSMLFVINGLICESEKTLYKMAYGALGFILLFTFIYTYSRAAWMLLPIFMLLYFLVLPSKVRINSLLYFISITLANLIILQPFATYSTVDSATKPKALLTFFVGICFFVLLYKGILFVQAKLQYNHVRMIYCILGVVAVAVIGFSYIALTTFEPIEFDNTSLREDRLNQIKRTVGNVEGVKSYTLQVSLESQSANEGLWPWRVRINSIDNENNQELLVDRLGSLSESGLIEIPFNTIENTKTLDVFFINIHAGTKVTFREVLLKDEDERVINNVKLKYKFIPEALVTRINSISLLDRSSTTRLTYYKDSFTIFKNNPVFGAGGGAWLALYPQYQSESYSSTEAHNLFLQTLVETGALGVLTLIVLILLLIKSSLKAFREKDTLKTSLLVAILLLIAHSGLDFNFSFHSIPIFLWVMIGMLDPTALITSKPLIKLADIGNRKYITIASICVSIVLLVSATGLMAASLISESTNKAINEAPLLDSINKMEKVVKLDPSNTKLRLDLIKMMRYYGESSGEHNWIQESEGQILKALEFDENSQALLREAASYYLSIGDFEKGFEYADRLTKVAPLSQNSYEFKSEVYKAVSDFYITTGLVDQALDINKRMLELVNEIKVANEGAFKPIQLSIKTLDTIFRARYFLENFNKPEELAKLNNTVYISYLDLEGATGYDIQWNKWGPSGTQIESEFTSHGLTVYNPGTARGIVYSPSFSLDKNKSYQMEILFSNSDLEQIKVDISSLGKTPDISHVINTTHIVNGQYIFQFNTNELQDEKTKSIIFNHPGNTKKHFKVKQVIIREIP